MVAGKSSNAEKSSCFHFTKRLGVTCRTPSMGISGEPFRLCGCHLFIQQVDRYKAYCERKGLSEL